MSVQACWKFKVSLAEELGYLGEIICLEEKEQFTCTPFWGGRRRLSKPTDPCGDVTRSGVRGQDGRCQFWFQPLGDNSVAFKKILVNDTGENTGEEQHLEKEMKKEKQKE